MVSRGADGDDGWALHAEPGGAAVTVELGALTLSKLSVGPADNCAYLLRCRATGAQLLVDAAAEPARLLAAGAARGLERVVTTHRHADHHGALADVVRATGARTAAGDADADAVPVPVDERLHDGDEVAVGDVRLAVVALVGHTPGSVALRHDDPGGTVHLFTGDSLFPGGPGRTWSPEDFTSLMDDLEEKVFGVLGDSTVVHPGHGDGTTLGAERPHLGQWRARGW